MNNSSKEAPTIRLASQANQSALERIIGAVELFPAEMLGDMIAPYLAGDGSYVEFVVRRDWNAAEILPGSFPGPMPTPATAGAAEAHERHAELRRHRRRGRAMPEMWHENTLDLGRAD